MIDNTYDLLYRRTRSWRTAARRTSPPGSSSARRGWPRSRLGNGLICTWMNNARTNSAVQCQRLPNPAWGDQSSDRLGYDGAGRMITKRYLAGGIDGSARYNTPTSVVGFTTAYDRASNKFYERALHAENRSHLYEPFDSNGSAQRRLRFARPPAAISARHAGLHRRHAAATAAGRSRSGPISLAEHRHAAELPCSTAWATGGTRPSRPWAARPQTEVRQHNGLNQITRISEPGREPIRSSTRPTTSQRQPAERRHAELYTGTP